MEYRLQPDEGVDTGLSLAQMGVDSLEAVELRRWCRQVCEVEVMVFEVLAARPLRGLRAVVAGRIKGFGLREMRMERGRGRWG